ncbi:MAG: hypothetical protein RIS70_1373 [Planctomycetota bacterium]
MPARAKSPAIHRRFWNRLPPRKSEEPIFGFTSPPFDFLRSMLLAILVLVFVSQRSCKMPANGHVACGYSRKTRCVSLLTRQIVPSCKDSTTKRPKPEKTGPELKRRAVTRLAHGKWIAFESEEKTPPLPHRKHHVGIKYRAGSLFPRRSALQAVHQRNAHSALIHRLAIDSCDPLAVAFSKKRE